MPITAVQRDAIMASISEATEAFDPAAVFVGVFTAIVDNGISTVMADLTLPSGAPGDVTAVTTWGTAYVMSDGRAVRDGPPIDFRPASSSEATTVIGWYYSSDDPPTELLEFGYFDDPIPLPDEFAVATVIPRLTVDPNGRWEANVVYNG